MMKEHSFIKWASFLVRLPKNCSLAEDSIVHLKLVTVVMVFTSLGEQPGFPTVPEFCLKVVQAEIARSLQSTETKLLLSPLPALSCSRDGAVISGHGKCFPKKQLSVLHADIHLRMGLFFSRIWTCLPLSAHWQGTSLCSQLYQAFLSKPCWKADPPGTTVNSCPQLHALGWCPGEITSGTPRCSVGCACFSARKIWFICNLRKFDLEVIKTHQMYTFTLFTVAL